MGTDFLGAGLAMIGGRRHNQGACQSDQAKRTSDYQDAEKQILDDSSYVFINHGVAVQATTTKVHNFLLLPTTIMLFSQVWLA